VPLFGRHGVRRERVGSEMITVGRFGFRGAKKVQVDNADVVVDCRVLKDPAYTEGEKGKKKKRVAITLEQVQYELLEDQRDATLKLVQKVVDAVLDDKNVCVMCLLGQYRSQAVAAIAAEALQEDHRGKEFVGPLLLGGLKKTP
jgi:RNase adaptor protein for sRNA GlmZ degradation